MLRRRGLMIEQGVDKELVPSMLLHFDTNTPENKGWNPLFNISSGASQYLTGSAPIQGSSRAVQYYWPTGGQDLSYIGVCPGLYDIIHKPAFTIEFWISLQSVYDPAIIMCNGYIFDNTRYRFVLQVQKNASNSGITVMYGGINAAVITATTTGTQAAYSTFNHVAITRDASTITIYINGVRYSSHPNVSEPNRLTFLDSNMYLFNREPSGGIQGSSYSIDEFAVWEYVKYTTSSFPKPTKVYPDA